MAFYILHPGVGATVTNDVCFIQIKHRPAPTCFSSSIRLYQNFRPCEGSSSGARRHHFVSQRKHGCRWIEATRRRHSALLQPLPLHLPAHFLVPPAVPGGVASPPVFFLLSDEPAPALSFSSTASRASSDLSLLQATPVASFSTSPDATARTAPVPAAVAPSACPSAKPSSPSLPALNKGTEDACQSAVREEISPVGDVLLAAIVGHTRMLLPLLLLRPLRLLSLPHPPLRRHCFLSLLLRASPRRRASLVLRLMRSPSHLPLLSPIAPVLLLLLLLPVLLRLLLLLLPHAAPSSPTPFSHP